MNSGFHGTNARSVPAMPTIEMFPESCRRLLLKTPGVQPASASSGWAAAGKLADGGELSWNNHWLPAEPSAAEMAGAAPWAELQPVLVERQRANALHERLQQEFDAGRAQQVDRRELRFSFVPMPRSYWFPQNCADLAAEWLTELGCDVGWLPIRLGLAEIGRAHV